MSIKVMIVEDHPIVMRGIQTLLSLNSEIEVIGVAVDGVEAVEKVCKLKPDVVIMDIILPRMNGLEATKLIKQKRPSTRVIVLTGLYNDHIAIEALVCGAECCLSKTWNSNKLLREIKGSFVV